MLKPKFLTFLCLLMTLSLFSVGFATWTISQDSYVSSPEDPALLETDDVHQIEYVTLTIKDHLHYTQKGFIEQSVDENGVATTVLKNKLVVNVNINVLEYSKHFKEFGGAKLDLTFSLFEENTKYDIFGGTEISIENVVVYNEAWEKLDETPNVEMTKKTVKDPFTTFSLESNNLGSNNINFDLVIEFNISDSKVFSEEDSPFTTEESLFNLTSLLSFLEEKEGE